LGAFMLKKFVILLKIDHKGTMQHIVVNGFFVFRMLYLWRSCHFE